MTLVIAHRGASRDAGENTIAAFRRAGEIGADGVELDVRRTADGQLVVHHDPHLTDGRAIVDVDQADLPIGVASFDDALDACEGMFVNIEIKNVRGEPDHDETDRVAGLVASDLRRRGGGPRWLVSSFRYPTIDRIREVLPTVRTAWLTLDLTADAIARTAQGGHTAVHPGVASVDEIGIRRSHAAGLAVNVWTCNDPSTMRDLIAWGVDGICTDVPDVALAVRSGRYR